MRPIGHGLRAFAIASALALGFAAGPGSTVLAAEATVAVATNFLVPLRALAVEFASRTGHSLRISSGSTGQLFAQITNGAPYDVFLSADAARPQRLEEAGATLPGTRRTYALGRIVLWSAYPGRVDAGGAEALGTLGEGKDRNCEPRGRSLTASLHRRPWSGSASGSRSRTAWSGGSTSRRCSSSSAPRNAAMGFIAMSQLSGRPKGGEGSIWIVPGDLHEPIRQDMVLLSRAEGERGRIRVPRLPRRAGRPRPHRGVRLLRPRRMTGGRNPRSRR